MSDRFNLPPFDDETSPTPQSSQPNNNEYEYGSNRSFVKDLRRTLPANSSRFATYFDHNGNQRTEARSPKQVANYLEEARANPFGRKDNFHQGLQKFGFTTDPDEYFETGAPLIFTKSDIQESPLHREAVADYLWEIADPEFLIEYGSINSSHASKHGIDAWTACNCVAEALMANAFSIGTEADDTQVDKVTPVKKGGRLVNETKRNPTALVLTAEGFEDPISLESVSSIWVQYIQRKNLKDLKPKDMFSGDPVTDIVINAGYLGISPDKVFDRRSSHRSLILKQGITQSLHTRFEEAYRDVYALFNDMRRRLSASFEDYLVYGPYGNSNRKIMKVDLYMPSFELESNALEIIAGKLKIMPRDPIRNSRALIKRSPVVVLNSAGSALIASRRNNGQNLQGVHKRWAKVFDGTDERYYSIMPLITAYMRDDVVILPPDGISNATRHRFRKAPSSMPIEEVREQIRGLIALKAFGI